MRRLIFRSRFNWFDMANWALAAAIWGHGHPLVAVGLGFALCFVSVRGEQGVAGGYFG